MVTKTYGYLHILTSTYIYLHILTYAYESLHILHMHKYTYIYLHILTCTYMYLHIPTCTYVYLHVDLFRFAVVFCGLLWRFSFILYIVQLYRYMYVLRRFPFIATTGLLATAATADLFKLSSTIIYSITVNCNICSYT